MRRFAVLTIICSLAMPALTLAQTVSAPPPGAPEHWDHHHGDGLKKMQAKFDAANTAHDGHLTLAQAQSANLTPVVDHFNDIDSAHRGYVTFNEVEAWHLDNKAKHLEQRAAQLRAAD